MSLGFAPPRSPKVLIAQPDAACQRMLCRLVRPPCTCEVAASGDEALTCLQRATELTSLLVDTALPGGCALDVCEQALHRFPFLPAVVIGAQRAREHINRAARMGAFFFALPLEPADLVALRFLMLGQRLSARQGRTAPEPSATSLTKAEQRIASLSLSGMERQRICETLGISQNTLKWHVGRMLKKFQVRRYEQLLMRLAVLADPALTAKAGHTHDTNAMAEPSRGPQDTIPNL